MEFRVMRRTGKNEVAPKDQRPSFMEEGNPLSQPRGEFHGRSERFSGSVVAHPVNSNAAPKRTSASKVKRSRVFIRLINQHLITFFDRGNFPAGHHIGNAAFWLHCGYADFCD